VIIAFYKPWNVLSQFNQNPDYPEQRTLSEFDLPEGVWPVGRLDRDSEGLLLLTSNRELERRLLLPEAQHQRSYLAQVEGEPSEDKLDQLRVGGLVLKTHTTLPCSADRLTSPPQLPKRISSVRSDIPTSWLQLVLTEGKNRQVRRRETDLSSLRC